MLTGIYRNFFEGNIAAFTLQAKEGNEILYLSQNSRIRFGSPTFSSRSRMRRTMPAVSHIPSFLGDEQFYIYSRIISNTNYLTGC